MGPVASTFKCNGIATGPQIAHILHTIVQSKLFGRTK